jgi:DNA-directed RNA polymerase sigma subunit (sigma70/sigma32)
MMEENDSYVYVRLTPREARVVEMFLAARPKRDIAKHFAITTGRLNQIIQKARRKVDYAIQRRNERARSAEETNNAS